jgi:hypothetical protein
VTNTLATFNGFANGVNGTSISDGGIAVSTAGAPDVYIAKAFSGFFGVPNTSKVLTADGDENFRFARQDGASFTAIAFDFYTNPFGAPVFKFFDASNTLIGSVSVAQTPSTLGFIGFTSTTAIAYMTTVVDRGGVIDTGYDNVVIGTALAVPEPSATAMVLAALGIVGFAVRRARPQVG